jgi:streptogramin lyase
VDGAGNLFVTEARGGNVLEVPAKGGTPHVVGSGFVNPYGIAVDPTGDVFVQDFVAGNLVEIFPGGGQVTLATNLIGAMSIAVSGGDIYIADALESAVYKWQASNGQLVPIGSNWSFPNGVAVDASGNLFVTDAGVGTLTEISLISGTESTIATNLPNPRAVAVDFTGDIFVPDAVNNNVREWQRKLPSILQFATTAMGSTSAPKSVEILNIGTAQLNVSTITIGANFEQVSGSGTPKDCAADPFVNTGSTCNLSIVFAPTRLGPIQSTAVLQDKTATWTQTIALQGTGARISQD